MIEIHYKCHCMPSEVSLLVRERTAEESVVEWMESVARPALGVDHATRSPLCMSSKMEYLKIPVDDDTPIGNRRKH
jgi:hypothetical protein